MATTTFVAGTTLSDADWFNDVDALIYDVFNEKTTAGTSGTILRSNGTNIVNTTATYPATTTANRILYSTDTNAIGESANLTFDGSTLTINALTDISGASAGQVKFPATQNASADANTLDDYEEGTWTPGLTFDGGSTGMTFGAQAGRYIKVGRLCIASFRAVLTAKGSSAGNAAVTGLPFTAVTVTNLVMAGQFNGSALSSITGNLAAIVSSGGTTATLEYTGTGTATPLTEANFSDTSDISGTLVYLTAA